MSSIPSNNVTTPSPFFLTKASQANDKGEGRGGGRIGKIHSLESFGTVDGPGIRFVVFLQGCPLRCQFCHNPDTWDVNRKGKFEWTPQETIEEVLRYKSFIQTGGLTVSGGEPLVQAEYVKELFTLAHKEGITTCLDTSGAYVHQKAMEVLDVTDVCLLDIKTMNPELYPTLTGLPQTNNLKFLDELQARGIETWIRHVVVPEVTDNEEWLRKLGQHVQKYSVVKKLEILPYHTLGAFKYGELGIPYPLEGVEPLSRERTAEIREMMKEYVDCVQ